MKYVILLIPQWNCPTSANLVKVSIKGKKEANEIKKTQKLASGEAELLTMKKQVLQSPLTSQWNCPTQVRETQTWGEEGETQTWEFQDFLFLPRSVSHRPVPHLTLQHIKSFSLTFLSFLLSAYALCFTNPLYAQTFGNEWINKNQTYYKISLAQDGVYKVTYADLQQVGFPVGSVDPRGMQLFFRGKEQAIVVQGQQDARFDTQDYILFYGQRNDGTPNRELYTPQEAQPHPYYNLYSDTAAYFLTWRLDGVSGKRMETFSENNISGLPAEPYHVEVKRLLLVSNYSLGRQYPLGSTSSLRTHLSTFDYGEGWTGSRIQQGQSGEYTVEAPQPYTSGPKPQIEILLAGRNNLPHRVNVQIGSTAGSLRNLAEVNFAYYDNLLLSQAIEWSDISSGQLVVRVTPNGVDGQADNVSVSYIQLTYPQIPDAANQPAKRLHLKANTQGKAYLEVAQAPAEPALIDITVPDDPVQIGFQINASQLSAVVPQTTTDRELLLSTLQTNVRIRKATMAAIDPAADYLIITNAALRQAAGTYTDPVEAYRSYRASATGGGFRALAVNIQALFDQFSYGEVSPLAVRRFAAYLLANGSPQYLLLIGKGLTVDNNYYRKDPAAVSLRDLVLTGGAPGSDIVFTAGLAGSNGISPAIPTGRINARNATEVAAYLDKVKEQESRTLQADYDAPNTREALWKKRLVHLSGGLTASEQQVFAHYVDQLESIAEGDFLGGRVSTLSKTTNNATELINIAGEVNQGLSLITFFGHSSTTRTDIEIGYVSNDELGYRNKGKYPTILVNGCNAGNIFTNAQTFGEDWIATPNRGALHVIAHSAEGISNVLKVYSDQFYQAAFADSTLIGRSLGRISLEADQRFISSYNGTETETQVAQVQQMVLQGDPAATLFGRSQPDFAVKNNGLFLSSLDESPVTAYADSFAINLMVRNYGTTMRDSLSVTVSRTLNSGRVVTYGPVFYLPVPYEDTLQFVIRASEGNFPQAEGFGNNRFEVILDGADSVAELNENNNRAAFEYNIPLGGTVNVLPYDFAIINKPAVLLQAQPGNLQEAMQKGDAQHGNARGFLFEIDTVANFDSPLMRQETITAVALARWQVDLPVTQDSTVYYWRTRYAERREGEIDAWTQSSFALISTSPAGWAQLKEEQFNKNELTQLTYQNDRWQFVETSIDISLTTYGSEEQTLDPKLSISGKQFLFTSVTPLTCRPNSINGVAFERESLRPYLGIPPNGFDDLDPNNCGPLPQVINTFSNAQVNTTDILERYIDGVKNGDAVLLFSIGLVEYQGWQPTTLTKLAEIGVAPADLLNLQNGEPVIILGRKGAAPGSATVVRADPNGAEPVTGQRIALEEQVTGQYSQGTVLSRKIGPATAWLSLQHLVREVEGNDAVTLQVLAETLSGSQTVLYDNIAGTPMTDLSGVDAAQYPYLRLRYTVSDPVNFTPPQLRQWLVSYTGVPEGIIFMPQGQPLTLVKQEGDADSVSFGFYNIADVGFTDSLSVVYTFFNQDSRTSQSDTLRIAPLAAADTSLFTFPVATVGRGGVNDLRVQVNPRLLREQSYDNNQLTLNDYLTVKADRAHPVIDVAFDGVYILDGDIVSPTPLIAIEIRDDNPYRLKQDTAGIDLYLEKIEPETASISAGNARTTRQQTRIDLSSPNVTWTPATQDAPFKIIYQPETLADGTYRLSVQARDASGNASGSQPYTVTFEIINEATITHFYPYPNPFSTSTRFVFTLTGTEIPDRLKIQIMTVSGKVVREITQDELGPIRIGNNMSTYAWDGRDEFGDQLANGVYLYRVLMESQNAIQHRQTAADRAFTRGFGKLYILR